MTDQPATPDRPYTDADLRAEAARQHHELTEDPDYGSVGEGMTNSVIHSRADWNSEAWWHSLNEDDRDLAQDAIHDLISGAADVSEWAVTLGAAGLTPHEPYAIHSGPGGYDVAVQVATAGELTDAARGELLAAIRQAVLEASCRVLCVKPA
jgi:hypothetical protein